MPVADSYKFDAAQRGFVGGDEGLLSRGFHSARRVQVSLASPGGGCVASGPARAPCLHGRRWVRETRSSCSPIGTTETAAGISQLQLIAAAIGSRNRTEANSLQLRFCGFALLRRSPIGTISLLPTVPTGSVQPCLKNWWDSQARPTLHLNRPRSTTAMKSGSDKSPHSK